MKKRLSFLDFLRGFTLLSMIAYHAVYDLVYLYHQNIPGYRGIHGYLWQQSICWAFIWLSGFCSVLGRSSMKHQIRRGLLFTGCGLLITAVTAAVMPDSIVIMGILSFFGLAVLLSALLAPLLSRIPAFVGVPLSLLLFFITREVSSGFLGFEGLRLLELPDFLYRGFPMMLLGFPWPGFFSTDYFPLLPWIFLYWGGMYSCKLLYPDVSGSPRLLERSLCPPLEALGRHTLPIYLIHQPALMAAFTLFDWIEWI